MSEILEYREDFGEGSMRLYDGSQTEAFLCESDIVIYVGNRGVGKTHLILSKALPHISKPYFRSIYFRKQVKDSQTVGGIADKSKNIFGQFGRFNESLQLLTWKFDSGARIVFGNYSASESDFAEAIQGVEYHHALIDEVTQISEERFNAIYSNLRNTQGEKTQIFGTCNADPDSWIKNMIQWWIDPDTGYHIPERNGVERYFYQYGDDIRESIWGDTKAEVVELAKEYIDAHWTAEMAKYGTREDFVQSITVYEGKMSENKSLMKSGGVAYYGKLLTGSLEMKGRYAKACWNKVSTGSSMLSEADWIRSFQNAHMRTGEKFASLDVAGSGTSSDKIVLFIWDGFHVENVYASQGLKAKELNSWVSRHLSRHGVRDTNFVYDGVGVGHALSGYHDGAMAFMSQSAPSKHSKVKYDGKVLNVYKNARAEVAGDFVDKMLNSNDSGECGISFSESALNTTLFNKTLREHLLHERRALVWNEDREGVKQLLGRKDIAKMIGHSPDFLFALMYRMALDKKVSKMSDKKASKLISFLNFR